MISSKGTVSSSFVKQIIEDKYLLCVIIASSLLFFSRFFWGYPGYLAFFDDDFFYYLKTAENFAFHFKSSFNNIYLTNGYHPLYFLIISIFSYGALLNQLIVFILVCLLATVSVAISYRISKSILLSFTSDYLSVLGALTISIITILIIKGGMEIILTIPLILYFIQYILKYNDFGKALSFKLGILSSLLILSRLDSAIFVALLILVLLITRTIKLKYAFFLLGSIPIVIYFILNLYYFGLLIPISGMAKQMKTDLMPALYTFKSIYYLSPNHIIYASIPFILNFISLFFWIKQYKHLEKKIKILTIISIIFPIVLILYNSIVSGWILWPWYFYIFIPSLISFFILVYKYTGTSKKIAFYNRIYLILIILYCIIFAIKKQPNDYGIYNGAIQISGFANNHKGIYAMGDRAGLAGFLIQSPLIQTEGLMMNKAFLTDIRTLDLNSILKKYHINYFIANNPTKIKNRWFAEEPHNHCGSNITSKGYFDFNPIDSIIIGNWKNYIFKIK